MNRNQQTSLRGHHIVRNKTRTGKRGAGFEKTLFHCCLADADITNHIMTIWMCLNTRFMAILVGNHHYPLDGMGFHIIFRQSQCHILGFIDMVGGFNPPEKYEFVRLDHHPTYRGSHKIPWCQTTNKNIYVHHYPIYIYPLVK